MLTGDIVLRFCSSLKEKRWCVPEIPALWRQTQEGPKFKANLCYLVSKERKDKNGWRRMEGWGSSSASDSGAGETVVSHSPSANRTELWVLV